MKIAIATVIVAVLVIVLMPVIEIVIVIVIALVLAIVIGRVLAIAIGMIELILIVIVIVRATAIQIATGNCHNANEVGNDNHGLWGSLRGVEPVMLRVSVGPGSDDGRSDPRW